MSDSDAVDGEPAAIAVDRGVTAGTNPGLVHWLAIASRIAGVAVSLLGMVVITGWISGVTILTRLVPGLATMKFNTAVGLALLGLSIVLLGYADRRAAAVISWAATAAYGLLGLLTMREYTTGRNFGIDNLFGFDRAGPYPGRPSETTAVCFVVMAISVLTLRRLPHVGQLAGLVVVAVASLAVIGYAFGVAELYTVGAYSPIALHTAIAFVVAGLAVLLARSDEGFVALVTADSVRGATVRKLLVPAVLGPVLVGGLLAWAATTSAVSTAFTLAFFTVSMTMLSGGLVWIIGSGLRHVDLRRAGAEDALDQVNRALADRDRADEMLRGTLADLQSSEDRFRVSVEHLHDALSVFSAVRDDDGDIVDFRWEFANKAQTLLTARYSGVGLVGRTLLDVLPGHGRSGTLAIYCSVVETGESFVDPSLWFTEKRDGTRRRRAFDVRATKSGDGLLVVTREVTEQREQEQELAHQSRVLERSNTEIKLLNGLGDMLQSCASAGEAYAVVAQSCVALFPAFSGSISVMHASRDLLDVEGSWGNAVEVLSFAPIDCWALRRGRPFVSGPIGPRCGHLTGSPASWCLCAPMVGQSEMMGVLHLTSAASDDDLTVSADFEDGPARRLAITVAGQMSMAFANLRLRDSLREMSIRDPLTGLFNRRYMEESLGRELSRSARDNTEVAVLVIDVDHFKAFNDTHGHEGGDAVLEAVGEVLSRYSRTSDVACRFGGEEFVVILPNCSLDDARLRADELRRRVADLRVPFRHIELSGPTISCGVAAFPVHGVTTEALIHAADVALYAAKKAGRDQIAIADEADPSDDLEVNEVNGPLAV